MADISISRMVSKMALRYLVQVSISRIVRKMTLRYLVQVDDVLVLHLREGDG